MGRCESRGCVLGFCVNQRRAIYLTNQPACFIIREPYKLTIDNNRTIQNTSTYNLNRMRKKPWYQSTKFFLTVFLKQDVSCVFAVGFCRVAASALMDTEADLLVHICSIHRSLMHDVARRPSRFALLLGCHVC